MKREPKRWEKLDAQILRERWKRSHADFNIGCCIALVFCCWLVDVFCRIADWCDVHMIIR